MDLLLLFKAAIMGLVEGITEFLPISSTGHLILAGQLLDFWTVEKRDMFAVAVQIGAIAAVIYEYWGKLWGALIGAFTGEEQGRRLSLNLIIASIPIVIIGLSFGDVVKAYLFNAITVAIALIVGGFIILWAERRPHQAHALGAMAAGVGGFCPSLFTGFGSGGFGANASSLDAAVL